MLTVFSWVLGLMTDALHGYPLALYGKFAAVASVITLVTCVLLAICLRGGRGKCHLLSGMRVESLASAAITGNPGVEENVGAQTRENSKHSERTLNEGDHDKMV